MSLVPTTKTLYEPTYDPNTDKFIDVSPFKKYDRSSNHLEYYCSCKCNSGFSIWSGWEHHCKLKTHIEYRENYKFFQQNLLACRQIVIDQTRDKHKLINKYKGLKLIYIEKGNEIKTLNEEKIILEKNMDSIVKDNYDIREELRVMTEKYNSLQKDMEELNDVTISDSDEEYGDCLEDTNISI